MAQHAAGKEYVTTAALWGAAVHTGRPAEALVVALLRGSPQPLQVCSELLTLIVGCWPPLGGPQKEQQRHAVSALARIVPEDVVAAALAPAAAHGNVGACAALCDAGAPATVEAAIAAGECDNGETGAAVLRQLWPKLTAADQTAAARAILGDTTCAVTPQAAVATAQLAYPEVALEDIIRRTRLPPKMVREFVHPSSQ